MRVARLALPALILSVGVGCARPYVNPAAYDVVHIISEADVATLDLEPMGLITTKSIKQDNTGNSALGNAQSKLRQLAYEKGATYLVVLNVDSGAFSAFATGRIYHKKGVPIVIPSAR